MEQSLLLLTYKPTLKPSRCYRRNSPKEVKHNYYRKWHKRNKQLANLRRCTNLIRNRNLIAIRRIEREIIEFMDSVAKCEDDYAKAYDGNFTAEVKKHAWSALYLTHKWIQDYEAYYHFKIYDSQFRKWKYRVCFKERIFKYIKMHEKEYS